MPIYKLPQLSCVHHLHDVTNFMISQLLKMESIDDNLTVVQFIQLNFIIFPQY